VLPELPHEDCERCRSAQREPSPDVASSEHPRREQLQEGGARARESNRTDSRSRLFAAPAAAASLAASRAECSYAATLRSASASRIRRSTRHRRPITNALDFSTAQRPIPRPSRHDRTAHDSELSPANSGCDSRRRGRHARPPQGLHRPGLDRPRERQAVRRRAEHAELQPVRAREHVERRHHAQRGRHDHRQRVRRERRCTALPRLPPGPPRRRPPRRSAARKVARRPATTKSPR